MAVSFDLVKDEDKMPMTASLDLSAVLNSVKHGTWDSWVETGILGELPYTVRLGMAGIFTFIPTELLEVALRFCAPDAADIQPYRRNKIEVSFENWIG